MKGDLKFMANKSVSKAKALKIIQNVLLIIVGILVACSVIQPDIIKYLLGIALVVYGAFFLFRSVYDTKSFIMMFGVAGGILLGIGIATMCDYLPLIQLMQRFIYIALIVLGGLLCLDAIVKFVTKKNNAGIFELVIGVILLVLGILFVALEQDMAEFCWIAFGVVLALYGLYNLIIALIALSKKA